MFENLGRALMLLRELREISQAQTARAAGIGKSQLSKYERSKELPKLESLEKILKTLNIDYFEFFYTLRFVDDRAASIGSDLQIPPLGGDPSPALLRRNLGSILHPETLATFQTIFADFFKLYTQMVEQLLLGRLNGLE